MSPAVGGGFYLGKDGSVCVCMCILCHNGRQVIMMTGVQHLLNKSIWSFFYVICLSVEMCSDSRRFCREVERLFLSFQLSMNLVAFLLIVKVTSMGSYVSGSSTDEKHTDGETGMLRLMVDLWLTYG